jgi:hypothetical protein
MDQERAGFTQAGRTGDCADACGPEAPPEKSPNAHATIRIASKELRTVLGRWETAYNKESFYRGLRVLLELQRNGSSKI